MSTLILVRHGEVEGIDPPRFRGHNDLPLTEHGVDQAQATRDAIAARWTPAHIYCSPLQRCVHTADIIGQHFSLKPTTEPGLIDIDYGDWTGLAKDDVATRWPEKSAHWQRAPQTLRLPGGDMLTKVMAHANMALNTICHQHPQDAVVLVAHDSVNRLLLCHALGLPLNRYWHMTQDPCGISVIDAADGDFTVHAINQTQHLLPLTQEP